jgi:hypothetical protein
VILVVVNLDPDWEQSGFTWLDLEALGVRRTRSSRSTTCSVAARSCGTGPQLRAAQPHVTPAHIFQVRPRHRTEVDFEQYR